MRGVPVVASATGGLAEIVNHGTNGLLFPNGDDAALTSCLAEIAEGRAFPDHTVPAVRRAQRRRNGTTCERHVARFEEPARRDRGG